MTDTSILSKSDIDSPCTTGNRRISSSSLQRACLLGAHKLSVSLQRARFPTRPHSSHLRLDPSRRPQASPDGARQCDCSTTIHSGSLYPRVSPQLVHVASNLRVPNAPSGKTPAACHSFTLYHIAYHLQPPSTSRKLQAPTITSSRVPPRANTLHDSECNLTSLMTVNVSLRAVTTITYHITAANYPLRAEATRCSSHEFKLERYLRPLHHSSPPACLTFREGPRA
jgi:hypothetical protein